VSVWLIPLAAGAILFLVGLPLLIWQVVRAVTAGTTEVEILGFKVKSPYASIVLIVIGGAFIWFSTDKLAEEGRLQVVDAKVAIDGRSGANVLEWTTTCPATVEVTGVIAATGRGTVTYEFIRQLGLDGQEEPSQHATVDFSGTKSVTVTDVVVIPFPEGTYYYQVVLHVVGPTERRSDAVGFTVTCDSDAEGMPPGMPPPPSIGVGPPG